MLDFQEPANCQIWVWMVVSMPDRITTKIKNQKKLKVRLVEDRRLDYLEQETLAMLDGAEAG
jgi:hypothetical protein